MIIDFIGEPILNPAQTALKIRKPALQAGFPYFQCGLNKTAFFSHKWNLPNLQNYIIYIIGNVFSDTLIKKHTLTFYLFSSPHRRNSRNHSHIRSHICRSHICRSHICRSHICRSVLL